MTLIEIFLVIHDSGVSYSEQREKDVSFTIFLLISRENTFIT